MMPSATVFHSLALAALCNLFPISTGHQLQAQGKPVRLRTCSGTIASLNRERGEVALDLRGEGSGTFRIDRSLTPIYHGLRSLGIDELREGMRVEIDYRPVDGQAAPPATWIEIIEGPPES